MSKEKEKSVEVDVDGSKVKIVVKKPNNAISNTIGPRFGTYSL